MRTFKQQGMATILLVLLIGITVMLITASVARALMTKKEAGTAAHAQTNAQILGWAGVRAFQQHLESVGGGSFTEIIILRGTEVTLKNVDNTIVKAKNIQVIGCEAENVPCKVIADISADNKSSKAATTITAVYDLVIEQGTIKVKEKAVKASFGGKLTFTGGTLKAEEPNSKVVLNVDGPILITEAFKLENISELTINATGDVDIACSHNGIDCARFHNVNINSKGSITIHDIPTGDAAHFGELRAEGNIKLQTRVNAKNLYALGNVEVTLQATAQNIYAGGNVKVWDRSHVQNIYSNGNVIVETNSSSKNVEAQGYVMAQTDGIINGTVKSIGNDKYLGYAVYLISGGEIKGTTYVRGDIRVVLGAKARDIYATGDIDGIGSMGKKNAEQKNIAELNFPRVDTTSIYQQINQDMNFGTLVDVRPYKLDANYIFQSSYREERVFLNHLKDDLGNVYMTSNQNGTLTQEMIEAATGNRITFNQGQPLHLGRYKLQGSDTEYIGAICQSISNGTGTCNSTIINFLPRISIDRKASGTRYLEHYGATNNWHVRSLLDKSSIDNAVLAPGIFYFDNDLWIDGYANGTEKINGADATDNAYTNTFLAEGSIYASVSSPRIFSPYSFLRNNINGDARLICDRSFKNKSGMPINGAPQTQSVSTTATKYLVPVNLCKNETEFAQNMNRDPLTGEKLTVNIKKRDSDTTGKDVPKIDLGYVALMANGMVRLGECHQVYGDVYSREYTQIVAACLSNSEKSVISGNIATQGTGNDISKNTFNNQSTYIIPKDNTSFTDEIEREIKTGTTLKSTDAKWARYK